MPLKDHITFVREIDKVNWHSIKSLVYKATNALIAEQDSSELPGVMVKQPTLDDPDNESRLNDELLRYLFRTVNDRGKVRERIQFLSSDGQELFLARDEIGPAEPLPIRLGGNSNFDFLVALTLIIVDNLEPGAIRIETGAKVSDWLPALEFVREKALETASLPRSVDPNGEAIKMLVANSAPATATPSSSTPTPIFRDDCEHALCSLFF